MNPQSIDEMTLRKYLLGRLAEAEYDEIDERLLTDDNFAGRIELVEDEIIEDYLDGTLAEADKQAAESHFFQAPEHQHKLHFARLLRSHLLKQSAPQPVPWQRFIASKFQWAASAAIVALLALTTGLGIYTVKLRHELEEEIAKNQSRQAALEADLARARASIAKFPQDRGGATNPNQAILNNSLELTTVISPVPLDRSTGSIPQVLYRPGPQWLEIHISLMDFPADSYSLVLKKNGQKIWSDNNLHSTSSKLLVFRVPYKLISAGEYSLLVNDRQYIFKIS